ncbi:MAG: hypothetical protein SVU32_01380, partial [Candidatus Nanohaloarchaea archaeon]|nr:hypothetical protein [Candidatus Nanohaloarchaea archaeon]
SGYQDDAWRDAQEAFITFDPETGKSVEDRYEQLFASDAVRGPEAGIVLMDFRHMDDDAPAQVVGHTTATGLPDSYEDWNPQARGDVVNINTIRDAVSSDDP